MNAVMRLVGLVPLAAAVLALVAPGARAGGPLSICNDAGRTPIAYSPATVNLNYDRGGLGARTKAQADAIVANAVALWTNVGTATVEIGRGADLPVDVTAANYATYLDDYSDGLNPVIYDTDGSIIDDYFGIGSKNSVLGFAGSASFGAPTCRYAEGEAVINGFPIPGVTDTTISVVFAHEIGHLIGLDHTQLDSTQGLQSAFPSNFPLMYPLAFRDFVSLHEDDEAAVSALYPGATLSSVYGQISGTFVRADGVTPVRGANLWATETTSGKHYSIVSDYRRQNTGYFKLLLPAGTYTLRAEAIQSGFTGGSSVGPYADTSADLSFQPPLYVGGVPMATVTLGGATPTTFVINAGCAATLTFRIDGSGTVGGDCSAIDPDVQTIIDHYYQSVLGRAGDPGGIAFWQAEVARLTALGADPAEAFIAMAVAFYGSAEFAARGLDDGAFVDSLYITFFNRAADPGGRSYWVGQIAQGLSRDMVMYAFMFSPEFASFMAQTVGTTPSRAEIYAVIDFYRGAFGRLPDSNGLRFWVNRFRGAQCSGNPTGSVYTEVIAIASGFFESGEYWTPPKSNGSHINNFYNAFLRRGADAGGYLFWVSQLGAGADFNTVRKTGFIDSPEFAARVQQVVNAGCTSPMP